MERLLDRCINIALRAHNVTLNKYDGEIYLLHVQRVASSVGFDVSMTSYEERLLKCIAWLHDVVEDTDFTLDQIKSELIDVENDIRTINTIIHSVRLLTKVKGKSNEAYYNDLVCDNLARLVKLADIKDNFRRNHLIEDEETRLRMAKKYSLGLDILSC